MTARVISVLVLAAAIGLRQAIPPGPQVPVSDGWYHVASCSIARGRQASSIPLLEALEKKLGPCPICDPHKASPEIGAFVAAHGKTIAGAIRAREEAAAAEARRVEEEAAADRKRRLAEADDERRKRDAAPLVRVGEPQVRQAAQAAAAAAARDAAAFQRGFRAAIKDVAPGYGGPQTVIGTGALRITVSGPIARFEAEAMAAIGRGEPLARVLWMPDATIAVLPQQSDAPDIERIVVQRSDSSRPLGSEIVIAPLSSTLAARPLQFADGTRTTLHSGEIVFPISAFDPGLGVSVRVIAVPAAGAPINRTFSAVQLRAIQ
jgi:hypothetical protein